MGYHPTQGGGGGLRKSELISHLASKKVHLYLTFATKSQINFVTIGSTAFNVYGFYFNECYSFSIFSQFLALQEIVNSVV